MGKKMLSENTGNEMYGFLKKMFPYCRSITGDGVRKTLSDIKVHLPELEIHEIETGEKCFDWEIPQEWNIKDAYVKNEAGEKSISKK